MNDKKLYCFYVVYETQRSIKWKVFHTEHNLNSSKGLLAWIEKEKEELKTDVAPTFWKLLED
jgi:hypothetical protein